MKHPTEKVNGVHYPVPNDWNLNWVEGDVISWRYDDVEHKRIHEGPTAHVFVTYDDPFDAPTARVEVNGETIAKIGPGDGDRDDVFDQIGDVLAQADVDDDT